MKKKKKKEKNWIMLQQIKQQNELTWLDILRQLSFISSLAEPWWPVGVSTHGDEDPDVRVARWLS